MKTNASLGEIGVLIAWAGYCTAVSVVGASDHFELTLFLLLIPAQLAVGFLVPRWAVVTAPVLLTFVLGWWTFEAACPCTENGLVFFYALWTLYFALPGVALVALGVLARKGVYSEDRWDPMSGR
jgi:hypothetical protein